MGSVGTGLSPCRCGCPAHRCPRSQPGPVHGVAPAQSPQLVARTREDPGPTSGPLHAVSPPSHPEDAAVASAPTWGHGMWGPYPIAGWGCGTSRISQVSPCPQVSSCIPGAPYAPHLFPCTPGVPHEPHLSPPASNAPYQFQCSHESPLLPPPSSPSCSLCPPFAHHPQSPPRDAMSFSVTSSVSLIVCRA